MSRPKRTASSLEASQTQALCGSSPNTWPGVPQAQSARRRHDPLPPAVLFCPEAVQHVMCLFSDYMPSICVCDGRKLLWEHAQKGSLLQMHLLLAMLEFVRALLTLTVLFSICNRSWTPFKLPSTPLCATAAWTGRFTSNGMAARPGGKMASSRPCLTLKLRSCGSSWTSLCHTRRGHHALHCSHHHVICQCVRMNHRCTCTQPPVLMRISLSPNNNHYHEHHALRKDVKIQSKI